MNETVYQVVVGHEKTAAIPMRHETVHNFRTYMDAEAEYYKAKEDKEVYFVRMSIVSNTPMMEFNR